MWALPVLVRLSVCKPSTALQIWQPLSVLSTLVSPISHLIPYMCLILILHYVWFIKHISSSRNTILTVLFDILFSAIKWKYCYLSLILLRNLYVKVWNSLRKEKEERKHSRKEDKICNSYNKCRHQRILNQSKQQLRTSWPRGITGHETLFPGAEWMTKYARKPCPWFLWDGLNEFK